MEVNLICNNINVKATIDTAAMTSVVNSNIAKRIPGKRIASQTLKGPNGYLIESNESISVSLNISGILIQTHIAIVSGLNVDMLLGLDVLQFLPFTLDLQTGALIQKINDLPEVLNYTRTPPSISSPIITDNTSEDLKISDDLTNSQQRELKTIISDYHKTLANSGHKGRTTITQHTIDTGNHPPVYQHPYRTSHQKQNFIREEIQSLLKQGKIQNSNSPYGAPVVLPVKKDGSFRFAIDYRRLNKVTRKDGFPLPRIDDLLDRIAGAKYFATLDAKSGFHHVPMAKEDIPKTAFVTNDGQFEWLVMPFGLCNAPATFQRMMNEILLGLVPSRCLVYIDDILVFGHTWEAFTQNLKAVLHRLATNGILLNFRKCSFGDTQTEFLGNIVDEQGFRPNPNKTESVKNYPPPNNKDELRRFLGLTGYFSKFIESYAMKVAPLRILLRKTTPWKWTSQQQHAFDNIKTELIKPPVLTHFDPNQEHLLVVQTDASNMGIGAILLQSDKFGNRRPVIYASRGLSDSERRYNTTEIETLALKWAVTEKFYVYLEGKQFIVQTDHQPLCGELKLKRPSTSRLAKMIMKLQPYDFIIEHTKGKDNSAADALSRIPQLNSISLNEEQRKDSILQSYFQILKKHPHDRSPSEKKIISGMILQNEIILRGDKIVLPTRFRKVEMDKVHGHSHVGPKRMLLTLQQDFWWPGMERDVRHMCKQCNTCQKHFIPNRRKTGYLNRIDTKQIFEIIGIDFVGPLGNKTKRNNRHILVAVDLHSRYAFAKAIPSQDTDSTLQFLMDIIFRFGVPQSIISDNATVFTSEKFFNFCQEFSIHHRKTSINRPQSNGSCERFIRTLNSSLAKGQTKSNWDIILPMIVAEYNRTVHTVHGYTPFEVFFGRRPRSGFHNTYQIPFPLSHVERGVNQKNKESFNRNKRAYDLKRKPPLRIDVGDKVMVEEGNRRRRKLDPRWKGPYTVEDTIGTDCVRIKTKIFNRDKLRKI